MTAIEETSPVVQRVLVELIDGLQRASGSRPSVRLFSGTTVSLIDRVAAGTFSERLFYRLNSLHLVATNGH